MVETLMDGLVSEIERCSKLKAMYDQIPSGAFGALMIQQDIDRAKEAIASEEEINRKKNDRKQNC